MIQRPSVYGKDKSLKGAIGAAYGVLSPPSAPPTAPAPAPAAITPPLQPPAGYGAPPQPPSQPTTPGYSNSYTQETTMGAKLFHTGRVYEGLSQAEADDLKSYEDFIHSLPQYKGSAEAGSAAIQLYKRNLIAQRRAQGFDDHAIAKLGDANKSLTDQLSAYLAASGHSMGGGVAGAAMSNLQGRTSANVGELLAQQDMEKRKEELARQLAQMGYDQQTIQLAMQEYQRQHQGGFFHDLLGTIGSIGGALIGRGGGGGGGGSSSYGSSGYGQGAYGPPDANAYYGPWDQSTGQ